MATILFYSSVGDVDEFERVGFYATDIQLLRELGHEVVVSNSLKMVLAARYDVLFGYFYTWSVFAAIFARMRGATAFLTGGADSLDSGYNKSHINLFLRKLIFRVGAFFVSRIFAVSTTDFRNMVSLCCERKVSLVPHVVDTSRFLPGFNRSPGTLITIGWMVTEGNVRRKGMDTAIRILAKLRDSLWDAKLVIVGTPGAGTETLRNLASELGVSGSVEYYFNVSERRKIELLQSSAFYLQLSEFEGFGVAALEALACGACVVHTGRGGLADFMGQFGLQQSWPVDIAKVAAELIDCAASEAISDEAAHRRYRYVADLYSLSVRRRAFACGIPI